MNRARTYAVSAVVMLALDLLWLGVIAPPLYQREVGVLMRAQPGVIAAALPYIRNTSDYTSGQLGFIVGAVLWGSVLSSLFAGYLAEIFGRKRIIIASAFFFLGGGGVMRFGKPMAVSGQRLRLMRASRSMSAMAAGSSSAGFTKMAPLLTMRVITSRPSSVRTTVRVQSAN